MSKRPPDPVVVTVARARLEGGAVSIEAASPTSISLDAGQPLRVQVPYRFEEASREHESFRVRLRSRLADERPDDAIQHLEDHPLLSDTEWGLVAQEIAAPSPGAYDLFVDVRAEYGVRGWTGDGKETLDTAELAVKIPVKVHDAS